MLFMWRLAWYAINSMTAKKQTHFRRGGQRTEGLGTNQIWDDSDQMTRHYRMLCSVASS